MNIFIVDKYCPKYLSTKSLGCVSKKTALLQTLVVFRLFERFGNVLFGVSAVYKFLVFLQQIIRRVVFFYACA
jgi:hypothetical protein